ncbi:MAG TPA: putative zinc-binding protein [Paludibacter sp.]
MEKIPSYQIVSCSGASNTGKFADEVARMLSASADASMICLAKVAISDQSLIEKVKAKKTKIVVLDGCPINCAEKILGKEGITEIIDVNTTEFGIIKGKTPFSLEKAKEIAEHIKQITK